MSIINKLSNFIRANADDDNPESNNNEHNVSHEHDIGDSTLSHVLIDYENLQPKNLDKVNSHRCHIWLFVGKHQNKINTSLIQSMNDFGDRAHYIYVDVAKQNALDFHLSYYLGYIAAVYPDSKVIILSKDQGYESMMQHARDTHNFKLLTRHDDVSFVEKRHHPHPPISRPTPNYKQQTTIPPKQNPAPSKPINPVFNKCIRNAIILLTQEDAFHPRMRHRLEKLIIQHVIQPVYQESNVDIDEEGCQKEAEKVLKQLITARFVSEDKETGMLHYHTDEESLYQRLKYFVEKKRPEHVVPLKELVAYNYGFRDMDKDGAEVRALIERLKNENLLNIIKGGHIFYPNANSGVSMTQMVDKATRFIQRGHALPSAKTSLYNVIGTHLGIKNEEQVIHKVILRLEENNLVQIDGDQVSYPSLPDTPPQ